MRMASTIEAELDRAERKREPARLVVEELVVDAHVERDAEHQHQRDELDRPPAVDPQRNEERGERRDEARLDAACQRVRHTRRVNARAAYLAPAIVSAAGNAHWPATPAIESVRRSSVRAGTVESGASARNRSCVSSPCAATRSASSGSSRQPLRNPVAEMTWKPRGGGAIRDAGRRRCPTRARRVRRLPQVAQHLDALRRRAGGGTPPGRASRSTAAERSTADARARAAGSRPPPIRPRAHSATRSRRPSPHRLPRPSLRSRAARTRARAPGMRDQPGMAGRDQHMRESALRRRW